MPDHQNNSTRIDPVQDTRTTLSSQVDQYRLLVDSLGDYAVFLLDAQGKIITWNKGAKNIKGYEPEEIIGQHFSTFYTADALAQQYPELELEEAQKQGRFEDEGWRVRKDGSVFWANVIITPLYNAQQELLGFSKITRDLTNRKKAEDDLYKAYQELKDSEERYRLLIEAVGDYAIFMLDASGKVATWNEGAKRIKGYEPEEIIGRSFSRFYSQQDQERGYPEYELAEARRLGRFEDLGWRIRKDGSTFWANVIITPIYNTRQELLGFSKVTRDLTDRKKLEEQLYRANEELKEAEEKSRLLVETVKDYGILMLNLSGEITSWNVGAERIKGYQAKEVLGRHFSLFYTREAIAKGFPQYELERALLEGRFEDEGWRIRKDGTAFWANVIITPIFDSSGNHMGFSKITRDLTAFKKNVELMQKNQELMRMNRELDNFVYTASHDLKSPIVNLEGLIGELKYEIGAKQEKCADLLPWIEDALQNLKTIVNELAEVTRVDPGTPPQEQINLEELVGEIKDSLRDKVISLQAQITSDFSQVPTVSYSRKDMRSVLYNLLSNAMKYSDSSRRPQIRIQTLYLPDEKLVEISVADNGLGIPANQKDKIFSMFRRVYTHVEGSGIGLYLVKKVLENRGDWIEVESELGVGSTFRVLIRQQV